MLTGSRTMILPSAAMSGQKANDDSAVPLAERGSTPTSAKSRSRSVRKKTSGRSPNRTTGSGAPPSVSWKLNSATLRRASSSVRSTWLLVMSSDGVTMKPVPKPRRPPPRLVTMRQTARLAIDALFEKADGQEIARRADDPLERIRR